MAQSLKQKTELSQKLLGEISNWQIVDLPKRFFHGCHSTDINININQNEIAGNKWFSTNEWYAGTYAWHFSRQENPDENSRYCLELTARDNYKVILRPTHIASFPEFLRDCFPDVTGYDLSRHFQNTLKLHLKELFGDGTSIIGYMWQDEGDGQDEILIPECENYLDVKRSILLPDCKDRYNAKTLQKSSELES
ncbi:hypothetical protein [Pseudoalteromonas spongiae]|uniref:hypothetical protein n=1 Tax=Pseudoalteromonas spongiae TaxID=298657 RepID=UPI0012FD5D71|nr:hypothetical protein [Pseudoalteromonas spongiae]